MFNFAKAGKQGLHRKAACWPSRYLSDGSFAPYTAPNANDL
jgi:hypothetical protein